VISEENQRPGEYPSLIEVWSHAGQLLHEIHGLLSKSPMGITSDGSRLVCIDVDQVIKVYELASGSLLYSHQLGSLSPFTFSSLAVSCTGIIACAQGNIIHFNQMNDDSYPKTIEVNPAMHQSTPLEPPDPPGFPIRPRQVRIKPR
jgi:hypothetical protein